MDGLVRRETHRLYSLRCRQNCTPRRRMSGWGVRLTLKLDCKSSKGKPQTPRGNEALTFVGLSAERCQAHAYQERGSPKIAPSTSTGMQRPPDAVYRGFRPLPLQPSRWSWPACSSQRDIGWIPRKLRTLRLGDGAAGPTLCARRWPKCNSANPLPRRKYFSKGRKSVKHATFATQFCLVSL